MFMKGAVFLFIQTKVQKIFVFQKRVVDMISLKLEQGILEKIKEKQKWIWKILLFALIGIATKFILFSKCFKMEKEYYRLKIENGEISVAFDKKEILFPIQNIVVNYLKKKQGNLLVKHISFFRWKYS